MSGVGTDWEQASLYLLGGSWLGGGRSSPLDEVLRRSRCGCPSPTTYLLSVGPGEAAVWLLGLTQKSPCLQAGNVLSGGGGGGQELVKGPLGIRAAGGPGFGHERDKAAAGGFSPSSHLPVCEQTEDSLSQLEGRVKDLMLPSGFCNGLCSVLRIKKEHKTATA